MGGTLQATSGFCCSVRKSADADGSLPYLPLRSGSVGCLVEFNSEPELMRDIIPIAPDLLGKWYDGQFQRTVL